MRSAATRLRARFAGLSPTTLKCLGVGLLGAQLLAFPFPDPVLIIVGLCAMPFGVLLIMAGVDRERHLRVEDDRG